MIIILEGPDGAGKTTLSRQLRERIPALSNAIYAHEGPPPLNVNVLEHYASIVLQADNFEHAIIDRLAMGETIYGPILRGDDRLGALGWTLMRRLFLARRVVHIVCLPPYDVTYANWYQKRARGEELFEAVSKFDEVYTAYEDKIDRAHDHVYDYTDPNAWKFLESRLLMTTVAKPLPEGYIGDPHGVVLFVGDAGADVGCVIDLPFFATVGSSLYLHEALSRARIGLFGVQLVNAFRHDGTPNEIENVVGRRVVALGNNAARMLKRACVEHRVIPHPQYWRRFRHYEIDTYATLLSGEQLWRS